MDRAAATAMFERRQSNLSRISFVEEPQYRPGETEPFTLTARNERSDHLFRARRHGIKASEVAGVRGRYDRMVGCLPARSRYHNVPLAALLLCAVQRPEEIDHWKALMSEEIAWHEQTDKLDAMTVLRITATCFEELQG